MQEEYTAAQATGGSSSNNNRPSEAAAGVLPSLTDAALYATGLTAPPEPYASAAAASAAAAGAGPAEPATPTGGAPSPPRYSTSSLPVGARSDLSSVSSSTSTSSAAGHGPPAATTPVQQQPAAAAALAAPAIGPSSSLTGKRMRVSITPEKAALTPAGLMLPLFALGVEGGPYDPHARMHGQGKWGSAAAGAAAGGGSAGVGATGMAPPPLAITTHMDPANTSVTSTAITPGQGITAATPPSSAAMPVLRPQMGRSRGYAGSEGMAVDRAVTQASSAAAAATHPFAEMAGGGAPGWSSATRRGPLATVWYALSFAAASAQVSLEAVRDSTEALWNARKPTYPDEPLAHRNTRLGALLMQLPVFGLASLLASADVWVWRAWRSVSWGTQRLGISSYKGVGGRVD